MPVALLPYCKTKCYTSPYSIDPSFLLELADKTINQTVENTVVAFVKGANERNEFLEKINKTVPLIYDKQVRTNKSND